MNYSECTRDLMLPYHICVANLQNITIGEKNLTDDIFYIN